MLFFFILLSHRPSREVRVQISCQYLLECFIVEDVRFTITPVVKVQSCHNISPSLTGFLRPFLHTWEFLNISDSAIIEMEDFAAMLCVDDETIP
jgi:hypothetical protein